MNAVKPGHQSDDMTIVVAAAEDIAGAREATLVVCAAAGIEAEQANFLAFAVSEATTNALQYGGGRAVVRVVDLGSAVVAEVSDAGSGFTSPEPRQSAADHTPTMDGDCGSSSSSSMMSTSVPARTAPASG